MIVRPAEVSPQALRRRWTIFAVSFLVALGGCRTAPVSTPESVVPRAQRPYIIDPLTGYPLTLSVEESSRVSELYAGLEAASPLEVTAAAAERFSAERPGLHAAQVLTAQVALASGDPERARELVAPVVDELPDYIAAQLVFGRASELAGEVTDAYLGFRAASGEHALAASRASELRAAAVAATYAAFESALGRGDEVQATAAAELLEELVPGERQSLTARATLARTQGDDAAELSALRRLHVTVGDQREILERLGDLEMASGDLAAAIERFEALVATHPTESRLTEKLEGARFRWRLNLLPPAIQQISERPVLDRAEVASLLYWLFPEIRYAEAEDPPVASDVLDHPRRDELLRVISLSLLEVDPTIHRFHPDRQANRATVLSALLRLLQRSDGDLACLNDSTQAAVDPGASAWVCREAAACGLLPSAADCLGEVTISGGEALELVRRTLGLLDSR